MSNIKKKKSYTCVRNKNVLAEKLKKNEEKKLLSN